MSFAKLDEGIIRSSIWFEPAATRILWITMLALKDQNGFVGASGIGLRHAANISEEEFASAIKCLESPDPDSRSKEFDGRRIEKIEGGWIILNHEKYRLKEDIKRDNTRERVKRYRALHGVTPMLPSVSVSASVSESSEKRGTGEEKYSPGIDEEPKTEFEKAFLMFSRMRDRIKKPMDKEEARLVMKKLVELANKDDAMKIKILEQSIISQWPGIFPLGKGQDPKSRIL